jgi:hypothetical protein
MEYIEETIVVERGVAVPVSGVGRPSRYPYRTMAVGDSMFCPGNGAISTYHWSRATGFRFVTRAVTERGRYGCRVWRIL